MFARWLAAALSVLAGAPSAEAHGIAGNRYFPGTLTFDDPAVADELILPNFSSLAHPNGKNSGSCPKKILYGRGRNHGRICLSNNAAERALRAIALGRRSRLFAGSDRGGERAAAMYTLIATAKLNGVDPQAWLADVLLRFADYPASRVHELLPWHWIKPEHQAAAA
jgi:hypothetical protein